MAVMDAIQTRGTVVVVMAGMLWSGGQWPTAGWTRSHAASGPRHVDVDADADGCGCECGCGLDARRVKMTNDRDELDLGATLRKGRAGVFRGASA